VISSQRLSDLYLHACEVELQAFKPGNVSVYADGHGMTVEDFRRSSEVSADPLCNQNYTLGEKIFFAVKATREAVGCNTNLGIILLCAPLIQAVGYIKQGRSIRHALSHVLSTTTVDDASWVFKAITLAAPGGLGAADDQDVNRPATVTLTDAMRLASDKDRIALQYITNYKDIFERSLLSYTSAFNRWGNQGWAAVSVYADLLSQFPDSHVERKYGKQYSGLVEKKMALLSEELSTTDNPEQLKSMIYQLDQELKSIGVNPGTTADMTVATVFTAFLGDLVGDICRR